MSASPCVFPDYTTPVVPIARGQRAGISMLGWNVPSSRVVLMEVIKTRYQGKGGDAWLPSMNGGISQFAKHWCHAEETKPRFVLSRALAGKFST
jgi:hypothetical protein